MILTDQRRPLSRGGDRDHFGADAFNHSTRRSRVHSIRSIRARVDHRRELRHDCNRSVRLVSAALARRSVRRAPDARARSPACRASPTSSTSASTTAASGARPTTARPGCRCSTASRPDRSARSPSRRRTPTSSTSAPAPASSVPTSPIGDGMYKSTDAGKTWTHLGLRDSQMIAMIDVDPTNPNRLFVAALGHPYGPNAERGIFRSTDGGKTFEKVLYKDEYTSGNDVRIDPSNRQHRLRHALAAAAELHRRRRLRRRRRRASSSRPTAARRGRRSPKGCRRSSRPTSRSRRAIRGRSTRRSPAIRRRLDGRRGRRRAVRQRHGHGRLLQVDRRRRALAAGGDPR